MKDKNCSRICPAAVFMPKLRGIFFAKPEKQELIRDKNCDFVNDYRKLYLEYHQEI